MMEGRYVYLRLIHIIVQQKPTQLEKQVGTFGDEKQ